jgi:hypothetical protein
MEDDVEQVLGEAEEARLAAFFLDDVMLELV